MNKDKEGHYDIIQVGRAWQVMNGKVPMGSNFNTEHVARQYAKRMQNPAPVNDLERMLHKILERAGCEDIQFRQRRDYGEEYVLLRIGYWNEIDTLTLNKLKEVEPTIKQFDIYDEDTGWKYGYDIRKEEKDEG